jgi:CHAT domain-containing protein/Flp pilus assembly protein TadD
MHVSRVLLGTVLVASFAAEAQPSLAFGASAEDAVAPGQPRAFLVQTDGPAALRLRVDQPHLDLLMRVLGADGALLGKTENLLGGTDPLLLLVLVERAGTVRVELSLPDPKAKPGRFRVQLGPAASPGPADRLRLEAQQLRTEADQIASDSDKPRYERALQAYGLAADRSAQAGDPVERALALTHKGVLLNHTSRLPEARATLQEALKAWQDSGDKAGESRCLDELGLVTTTVGEPREALALLERALSLRRELGPLPDAEGSILNSMAIASANAGDFTGARDRYTQALEFAREDGDASAQATVLKNRALIYDDLGEYERALHDFREAQASFHRLGNVRGEGTAAFSVGEVLIRLKRPDEAWPVVEHSLSLVEKAGYARFVGLNYNAMGLLRLEARRYDEAVALFQKALATSESIGDRQWAAIEQMNLATVLAKRGRPAEAVEPLTAACARMHALGYRPNEASCLTELAHAEIALERWRPARGHLLESLRLTEEVRRTLRGPSTRAAFSAKEHERYELLAGVLLRLHAVEPGAGWDASAFEVSETARARSLLEVLTDAKVDVRSGMPAEILAAEKDLDSRTEAARRSLVEVLGRQHSSEEADAVEQKLEGLREERERLEARMRASSPSYAALAPARSLSVEEIRTGVLDDTTVLVEYLVGDKESYVWVVSRARMTAALIPGRDKIGSAVATLYRRWSDPAALDDAPRLARALSQMVLGPVGDALRGAKRLVVVADGALQQIPFGALPLPGTTGPLLESRSVVSSPSASVLAVVRGTPRRGEGGPELAMLADPVLTVRPASPGTEEALEDAGLRALGPLLGTRVEATKIAAQFPANQVFVAFGPAASRTTAMGPEVARARIVHFATHALLDVRRPELSGIVLSGSDPQGASEDGFLSLADITGLHLSAQLVVLSACRTALGKEVRGEGLVGLTRGFMSGGAPRVIASLWKVPDAATAALMTRFYRLLLKNDLTPDEALRAAQLAVRRERRYSAPHAWAGWVLQGDWQPLSAP